MIRRALTRYLWQKTTWLTVISSGAWILAVMLPRDLLTPRDMMPFFIVAVHAACLAILLGRYGNGEFGFLYSRGFSRNALWWHTMLVAVLSALLPALVGAAMIVTGARSALQDLLANPLFPVVAFRENAVPWTWIALCLVLVPSAQYVWMRLACVHAGRMSGAWIAAAIVLGLFSVTGITSRLEGWNAVLTAIASAGVALAILIAARAAHRELEVRA